MKNIRSFFALLILAVTLISSCSKSPGSGDRLADKFVDSLLAEMTLDEKIGQLNLLTSGWDVTGPTLWEGYEENIKNGSCGNIFNALTVEYNRKLQNMAVDETRLGIPLLFGYDVIHGYKTIFPIPLAEACSWDMELIEKSNRLMAKEAAAAGITWAFSPVCDLTRDPRWGRISEASGEDPLLGELIAAAKVRGVQGDDLSDPLTLAACIKHFAAYGGVLAGREYNSVDMSERMLNEVYLRPYRAAVEAGATTSMTSFNDINGIPATGNQYYLDEVMRKEWGFDGVFVTDYSSIMELTKHGYARDLKHAGELALKATVDMDMESKVYVNHLAASLEEGKVTEKQIDEAVRRILLLKYRLGLFDDPYRYLDADREQSVVLSEEMMDHALESGKRSIVLLKNMEFNGEKILPLSKDVARIALIGPLADNQVDAMGSWHASGDETKVVTVLQGLKNKVPDAIIDYAKGCGFEGDDRSGFRDALRIARRADVVILALGENYLQNGEAASRTNLDLPGVQPELVKAIMETGKPVVLLAMAGRPLTIVWESENVPAILNTWHLGTRTGDAIAEVLFGDYNPSAKLVSTFPRNVGQIPIYYAVKNTGRPFDPNSKWTSHYIDVSNEPLYPFGFGLSYTNFKYNNLSLSADTTSFDQAIKVSVDITNTGDLDGEEIVQLYIHDMVASAVRPVKELKDFKKINLPAGETVTVEFTLDRTTFAFYDADMEFTVEPGDFEVMVGPSSAFFLSRPLHMVE